MTTFREVDFSLSSHREDSLLSAWDEEAFKELVSDGPRVSICSYLSVDPEFRGEIAPDMTLKLLAVLLSTKCLLGSDCDVMTGTMRCSRGTDKGAYRSGARLIKKSKMHGEDADLVGFFKKEILQNYASATHIWSEDLWNRRLDLTSSATISQVNTVKRAQ